MALSSLVDRLAAHRTLAGVPREQLQWLAEHGEIQQIAEGDVFIHKGEMVPRLFVMLQGRMSITVNRGAGPRKLVEWRSGDVTGLLPFSRMTSAPGDVVAEEPIEALAVHRDRFPEMIRVCQELTGVLVHVMLDRARLFRSNELHDEKMASLGRLSAGLAHELNNPASAVARSAKSLAGCLAKLERATVALGASGLSPEASSIVGRLRAAGSVGPGRLLSPLERAEREDAVDDWLDRHHLDDVQADVLASADVDLAALDELAQAADQTRLATAVRYIAMARSVERLAAEIETAASRIHGLVSAVKGFTHMDQASVPKPVDIGRGLVDTVTVLRGKARAKSVELRYDIEPGLPLFDGFGGELNQVWANLIDNALDAVPRAGHVTVIASRDQHAIVVRVVDDGPGIPEEIRDRIFDPFFTTKGVGEGTGLGLDIARRLVERHDGTIDVSSGPGGTEVRVTLPIARPAHAATAERA
jgi:signal transduction histidine kinase